MLYLFYYISEQEKVLRENVDRMYKETDPWRAWNQSQVGDLSMW